MSAPLRLAVGVGQHPLRHWINVDTDESALVTLRADGLALPFQTATLDDVYLGHVLEHFTYADGQRLLGECWRVLKAGARLGVVVPDTGEILRRYVQGLGGGIEFPRGHWNDLADLDDVCRLFLYSTVQPSHHLWSYDTRTLARALRRAGFAVEAEIDRWNDERLGSGAWYQFGFDARKEIGHAGA